MKKLISTLILVAALCCPKLMATQIIVSPGDATLSTAINAASDGDTLILKNDSLYAEYDTISITKKITIMAKRLRKLPELAGLPMITNEGKQDPFFKLYNNAELTLIGLDIDNKGAFDVIRAADKDSSNGVFSITIDRCRIHNCTFNQKDKGGLLGYPGDKMVIKYNKNLKKFSLTNSIIYDMGARSGYFKNWTGQGTITIENCTFYNIGQQSFYVKWLDESTGTAKDKLVFTYNHNTNYLISSNKTYPKEILGNATGQTTTGATKPLAPFNMIVKNSIFVKQLSTNVTTLTGTPTSMGSGTATITNDIKLLKNIFIDAVVQTTFDAGLSVTESSSTDPAFADSANRDFTVGTASVLTMADDGKTLGALYWDPSYKDVAVVTNANLSEIKVGEDALGDFKPATLSYNIELSIGTTIAPTVTAISDDDLATVEITQASVLPGKATIKVTAEDGTTINTYEVNFTVAKELSKVADLAGIKYGENDVPNFSPSTLSYTIALPDDIIDLPTITVTKGDARETVEITQATDLPGKATIVVTSEDGSVTKTYEVNYVIASAVDFTEAGLSMNIFPNPLSSISMLVFNLKQVSKVEIDIYNINGQLVSSILKSSLTAGNHKVAINATNLTNGLYILRTTANNTTQYLKIVKR